MVRGQTNLKERGKIFMPIMSADQYVVNELLNEKAKNSQLEEANLFLREDNRELEKENKKLKDVVTKLFYVEETSNGNGYRLSVKGLGYCSDSTIAYEWTQDIEKMSPEFLELIDALGLILPTPTKKDLENDPELVEQAMEKAKELQEEQKESEK